MEAAEIPFVCLAIVVVAALYSAVGHGGASGYLAVLSFFSVDKNVMASTALVLNTIVAGISFLNYRRFGHFSWRLCWPFMVGSVPFSFVGACLKVSPAVYGFLLSASLLVAAARLFSKTQYSSDDKSPYSESSLATRARKWQLFLMIMSGCLIGMVSGIVGIGGGIFLSPLMIFLGWSTVKESAATAALFIVVNSLAGLLGRGVSGSFEMSFYLPLLASAVGGALIGSSIGVSLKSPRLLRGILALVLIIAALKLFYVAISAQGS